MIRGFTCGSFDLCHAGHMQMFEECKRQCDVLIVGLQIDPSVDRPEKNRPVQSLKERYRMLEGVRWIDEIWVYDTEKELEALIKKLKPNVRFLGADWKDKEFTGKKLCETLGTKIVFNSRDHHYSTSELRKRVYEAEKAKIEG